jgi:hypothetical protein
MAGGNHTAAQVCGAVASPNLEYKNLTAKFADAA